MRTPAALAKSRYGSRYNVCVYCLRVDGEHICVVRVCVKTNKSQSQTCGKAKITCPNCSRDDSVLRHDERDRHTTVDTRYGNERLLRPYRHCRVGQAGLHTWRGQTIERAERSSGETVVVVGRFRRFCGKRKNNFFLN